MNTENLTPAQTKAIETGFTNNAILGNSLVKRGVMQKNAEGAQAKFSLSNEFIAQGTEEIDPQAEKVAALRSEFPNATPARRIEIRTELAQMSHNVYPDRYEPTEDYYADVRAVMGDPEEEKRYADAIEAEEAEADRHAGEVEAAQIERENAADRDAEIEVLRDEFEDAEDDRREEITIRLAQLGTVVYPEGTPQYAKYTADLRDALREWSESKGSAPFMVAEEKIESHGTGAGKSPDPKVFLATLPEFAESQRRDPRESRYAKIERWTDENLEIKYGILSRRIVRPHLRKADRMQAERQCQTVETEMQRRGLR